MKMRFMLVAAVAILSSTLLFQNCAGFRSLNSNEADQSSLAFENLGKTWPNATTTDVDSRLIASRITDLAYLDYDFRIFFTRRQNDFSNHYILRVVKREGSVEVANFSDDDLGNFLAFSPIGLRFETDKKQLDLMLLDLNMRRIRVLTLTQTTFALRWQIDLLFPITENEFYQRKNVYEDGLTGIILGKNKILDLAAAVPKVGAATGTEVACTTTQHLEGQDCVSDVRQCPIANGLGIEAWDGSKWGVCAVKACDQGFSAVGLECVKEVKCRKDQHLEGLGCTLNKRLCFVLNGTGSQVWNGKDYGDCNVTSCKKGYVKIELLCVKIPTCNSDQHLENNVCVSNVRVCPIKNGVGSQLWSGTAYGTCMVAICNSGYVKIGNACVVIPKCTAAQHLENNVCISNTKVCAITNGAGTQTWNGAIYGVCQVASCKPGYTKIGNACVVIPKCTTVQHLENNVCKANSRSCTIAYGTGLEVWNGKAFGVCTVKSCKTGYKISGNGCVVIPPPKK